MANPRRLSVLALTLFLTGVLIPSSNELIGLQTVSPAHAQDRGWIMPWDEPRVRRPRRNKRQARSTPTLGGRSSICLRLEQQLVQESSRGANAQTALPSINSDIRRYRRLYKRANSKLERAQCYDTFLFIKTLRQSRKCRRFERQSEDAKKRMRQLEAKRQEIKGGRRNSSYQDEIISALARNNCGANYQREARRRENANNPFSSSFWQDGEDTGPAPRLRYGALPFATYKTVCVRLCDGYYFPISFSTLPGHFKRDINACQSKCAAPADLYYYQNPGGAVEQMVSATRQTPYTKLPMAWRYRKEFVRGCSCKQAEYNPGGSDPKRKAQVDTAVQPNDGVQPNESAASAGTTSVGTASAGSDNVAPANDGTTVDGSAGDGTTDENGFQTSVKQSPPRQ